MAYRIQATAGYTPTLLKLASISSTASSHSRRGVDLFDRCKAHVACVARLTLLYTFAISTRLWTIAFQNRTRYVIAAVVDEIDKLVSIYGPNELFSDNVNYLPCTPLAILT